MGNKKNRQFHYNSHRKVFRKFVRKKQVSKPRSRLSPRKKSSLQATGSRIINLDKLQCYIERLTSHASQCGGTVKLTGEQRNGLASILSASCSQCSESIHLETSRKVKGPSGYQRWESNLAAVWGQMCTGSGHTHLQDTMSVLGVPVMSKTAFIQTERDIGEVWEREMEKAMLDAGKEEKRLAEQRGDYHQGVPAITVIVDGGWSKRSHKHSYNAKSGVGIIIGQQTGKILHIGVRNKYCSACAQGIPPEKHTCFKNWDASSSEMETDIILDGFLKAEQTHGVRYTRFVGDGDSSVFPTLRENVPIWGHDIQKVECANHACKCYRSSLEKLVTNNPSYKGKGGLTEKMRKRLTSAARCAIKMRSQEEDRNVAARLLERDLLNGPFHCFGYHNKCSPDFCSTARQNQHRTDSSHHSTNPCGAPSTSSDSPAASDEVSTSGDNSNDVEETSRSQELLWQDTVDDSQETEATSHRGGDTPLNVSPQLLHDVQILVSRLAAKSRQLVGNHTTNLAEAWMHIRCKFDGGKVINRSQSGSWQHRCMGAGLEQNHGSTWGPKVWNTMTKDAPNTIYSEVAQLTATKAENQRKRKAMDESKRKRRQSKYSRTDNSVAAKKAYSRHDGDIAPDDVVDDVSEEHLCELKESYYNNKVVVSKQEMERIEQNTKEQGDSDLWMAERRKRVTASVVGGIAKMQKKTKRNTRVKNMLYSRFKGSEATRYGSLREEAARQQYVRCQRQCGHCNLTTAKTGLVISLENPWLAASPDDRVYDPSATLPYGLAEYKNPHSAKQMTIPEACEQLKSFCLEKTENNTYQLKPRHDYYYQVQCQLYCTNTEWCDFVVHTEKDIHIERISRNKAWWDQQLPKLKAFYFDALLPELACPRHGKGGIREPTEPSSAS